MTDLQTKVRKVAKQALHRWMHSEVDGNPMDEIADAVLTVTLQEVLKYRPQHDEDCGVHWIFAERECTCGLSALQSFGQAPREQQEKEKAFARSDQPQLRACESDQRGEQKPRSIQENK